MGKPDEYHQCERADSWPVYDAQGIYLCRVCEACEKVKLAKFRPEVLSGYSQADVDEPIEPEEDPFEGLMDGPEMMPIEGAKLDELEAKWDHEDRQTRRAESGWSE